MKSRDSRGARGGEKMENSQLARAQERGTRKPPNIELSPLPARFSSLALSVLRFSPAHTHSLSHHARFVLKSFYNSSSLLFPPCRLRAKRLEGNPPACFSPFFRTRLRARACVCINIYTPAH